MFISKRTTIRHLLTPLLVVCLLLGFTIPALAVSVSAETNVDIYISYSGNLRKGNNDGIAYILYDVNNFDYVSLNWVSNAYDSTQKTLAIDTPPGTAPFAEFGIPDLVSESGLAVQVTYTNNTPLTESVEVAKLTLKTKGTVDIDTTGTGTFRVSNGGSANFAASIRIVPDTSGPPAPPLSEAAPYTVSLAPSTAAPDLNAADFTVDAKVSSTVEGAEFASFEVDFTYNAAAFVYDTATVLPEGVLVTIPETPNGTGHISRFGAAESLTTPATIVTLKFIPIAATAGSTFAFVANDNLILTTLGSPGTILEDVTIDPEPEVVIVTVGPTFLAPNTNFTDGFTLITYVATSNPANGFNYNGQPMYYAAKHGVGDGRAEGTYYYQILIPGNVAADGEITDGSATLNLVYDGNLNNNTTNISTASTAISNVNIIDAQIAFDLMKAHTSASYKGENPFQFLSMQDRLEADVHGDGALAIDDAIAIQYKAHHGHFAWES
jgi:hypothetical protein